MEIVTDVNPDDTKMIKYCMCCNKVIDIIEGYGERNPSSGICDDCLEAYYPELAPRVRELKRAPMHGKTDT